MRRVASSGYEKITLAADSQAESLFLAALKATDVTPVPLGEIIDGGEDPILGRSIEAGQCLRGSLGPLDTRGHFTSRRRRFT
jgi:hypothetical protein